MEKTVKRIIKKPWYCNLVLYFLIVAFVVVIDFLTYKTIMDVCFENVDANTSLLMTAGIVVVIDTLPVVLSNLIKIKEQTVKIMMISTLVVVGLLLAASIAQRLCSSDLVFNDAEDVLQNSKAAQQMSMLLLSILPIATSFFTFALSIDKKICEAKTKLEEIKLQISIQQAKKAELETTLKFQQMDFEEKKYAEAIEKLEKDGDLMKAIARQILAEHLGDKRQVTTLTSSQNTSVATTATTTTASAATVTPVAIPMMQQTY